MESGNKIELNNTQQDYLDELKENLIEEIFKTADRMSFNGISQEKIEKVLSDAVIDGLKIGLKQQNDLDEEETLLADEKRGCWS